MACEMKLWLAILASITTAPPASMLQVFNSRRSTQARLAMPPTINLAIAEHAPNNVNSRDARILSMPHDTAYDTPYNDIITVPKKTRVLPAKNSMNLGSLSMSKPNHTLNHCFILCPLVSFSDDSSSSNAFSDFSSVSSSCVVCRWRGVSSGCFSSVWHLSDLARLCSGLRRAAKSTVWTRTAPMMMRPPLQPYLLARICTMGANMTVPQLRPLLLIPTARGRLVVKYSCTMTLTGTYRRPMPTPGEKRNTKGINR